MKFKGNGIVWDAEKDCALCIFQDGELHTKDKRVIQILQSHDFEYEAEDDDEEDDDQDTGHKAPSNAELKAMLDQKGIKYNNNDNKNTLLKLLEGAE